MLTLTQIPLRLQVSGPTASRGAQVCKACMAGWTTEQPTQPEVSRRGAGSTLKSGLGREHLMKTLTDVAVIEPGGKETTKQRPYNKEWEYKVPPDPS